LLCIEDIVNKRKANSAVSFGLSSVLFADYIVKMFVHCVQFAMFALVPISKVLSLMLYFYSLLNC
jgi:hypothetical protein